MVRTMQAGRPLTKFQKSRPPATRPDVVGKRTPFHQSVRFPVIKFTILLKRKIGTTIEQFVDHHQHRHARLFMSVPVVKETVRRYIQQHALDVALPGMPPRKYDGITELWFDDVDSLGRCFSDAEYLQKIRPDEESFLDVHGCDFIVSNENQVFAG